MQVLFYTNTAHYKKVNKQTNLTARGGADCNLILPCTVQNPVITVAKEDVADLPHINYCYIPEFSRYYFVDDANLQPGGLVQFNMSVDPLTSNAAQILGLRCTVERQERNYDMELPDNEIPVINKRQLSLYNFGDTPFTANPTARHFALTVSGGVMLNI